MARGSRSRGSSDLNWLAGGAVAAALVPLLALWWRMPLWLALAIALTAGGGIVLLLTPRLRMEGFEAKGYERAKVQLARELLEEAEPHIARLKAAGTAIAEPIVREQVGHLAHVAGRIVQSIEADPMKVGVVRRFITYYLPRAADMAEFYRALEARPTRDAVRIGGACAVIKRLDAAFTKYADDLVDADLEMLDVELKLLRDALDEDLGRRSQQQDTSLGWTTGPSKKGSA